MGPAVLEEAPPRAASEESVFPFQPLVISAKSKAALEGQAVRLAAHLRAHPEQPLADVAYTLKEGRRAFEKRRVVVAGSPEEAAALLEGADTRRVFNHDFLGENPEVVFMFPGGGAQYAGMARDLYETEPVFADWMDKGLAVLEPQLDYAIRDLWLRTRLPRAVIEKLDVRRAQVYVEALIAEFTAAGQRDVTGQPTGRPTTLVFSSHNLGQVKRLASRVIYIEQGQVLADLPVNQFFNHAFLEAHCPQAHLFVKGETP